MGKNKPKKRLARKTRFQKLIEAEQKNELRRKRKRDKKIIAKRTLIDVEMANKDDSAEEQDDKTSPEPITVENDENPSDSLTKSPESKANENETQND